MTLTEEFSSESRSERELDPDQPEGRGGGGAGDAKRGTVSRGPEELSFLHRYTPKFDQLRTLGLRFGFLQQRYTTALTGLF